ncbi:MAG: phosphoglycerate mutase family protein [Lentisphaeraceae bacterium]|nr:phosphoglycerate mutase family protein [Lentisphaeraceae bacterium]
MTALIKLLIVTIFILSSFTSKAGLKIYYIRHAEAGHNVKEDWEERGVPKSEWPSYVGNPEEFTPKGLKQLKAATDNLQKYKFDLIACSPMWRTRNTILPYLKSKKLTAEIWPELKETSGSSEILSKSLPKLKEPILGKGDPIEIPKEELKYFTLLPEAKNHFKKYPKGSSYKYKTIVLKTALSKVIERIQDRYSGSDKSILLVGHGGSGKALFKLLTKKESAGLARKGMENAQMWMLEQQKNGSFQIHLYNGKKYTED